MMYGQRMMSYTDFSWLRFSVHVFVFIAVILLITIVVKQLFNYIEQNKTNDALELLKLRYAKGEIEEEEYIKKKELLK